MRISVRSPYNKALSTYVIIIIKRISRVPIYRTRWQHRVLNNNHTHTYTHTHTRTHTHTQKHTHNNHDEQSYTAYYDTASYHYTAWHMLCVHWIQPCTSLLKFSLNINYTTQGKNTQQARKAIYSTHSTCIHVLKCDCNIIFFISTYFIIF